MRAIVATRLGGPEVLELQDVPRPAPSPGQRLVKVHRAGVNFADLSSTQGKYAMAPPPPFIPGLEVSGHDQDGKPVFAIVPSGGYAEFVAADLAWSAEGMSLDDAGGYALTGLTAFFALRHVGRLQPGEKVLVTAAAGGVGSCAIQVARALGAGRIIAVAGSAEKRARALSLGADVAIDYSEPIPEKVDVMVDMVGGDAFARAVDSMAVFGRMVCIGSASGQVQQIPTVGVLRMLGVGVFPFSMGALRGRDPELFLRTCAEGIELVRSGRLRPPIGAVLPLAEAAQAHRLLGSRATMGKVLLAVDG
jgi:NADPH:quinone reductase